MFFSKSVFKVLILSIMIFTGHLDCFAATGEIKTVAGGDVWRQALHTTLLASYDVAIDSQNNIYIAESEKHVVRKIDTSGNISIIAGTGEPGFSGDGGQATNAQLNFPFALTIDVLGNIYVIDVNNHRVRKIDTTGVITTVAGDGTVGSPRLNTLATEAGLSQPTGIAVDVSGNLYISNRTIHQVHKVDTTGITTLFAGNGSARFSNDGNLAINESLQFPEHLFMLNGELYIADAGNHRIRMVNASGILTTVVGNGGRGRSGDGGLATQAEIGQPFGIFVSNDKTIYFTDVVNNIVRKVDAQGIISTIAGNGEMGFGQDGNDATSVTLTTPTGISIDALGVVHFAEFGNNRIRFVDPLGKIGTTAGGGGLNSVSDVVKSSTGDLYIADSDNHRILKTTPSGSVTIIAGTGEKGYGGDGGLASQALLNNPVALALDAGGNLYISDRRNQRIRKVDTAGIITTVVGNGMQGFGGDGGIATEASLSLPFGVAIDTAGNLFIADAFNQRIRKVDTAGIITTVVGNGMQGFGGDGGIATEASLSLPFGVAIDTAGNLFIADRRNNRIRKVNTAGIITTVAGDGNTSFKGDGGAATLASVSGPEGVFVSENNVLFISDTGNHRIRRVLASGLIETVVGDGQADFQGDGGLATLASLSSPIGIFIDQLGHLYISDSRNNRIRQVEGVDVTISTIDPALADVNGDGEVNFPDFLRFAQAFGTEDMQFDFDGDGRVGFADFLSFVGVFGRKSVP